MMRLRRYLELRYGIPLVQKLLPDWANLERYRDANARLPACALEETRVVFLGDSITDDWQKWSASFFTGKPYINRGISGQTTSQMLVRFRPDVIMLQPRVVVIQGGSNDIARDPAASALEQVKDNLRSMAELARANGIRVILASHLPVTDAILPQTARRPPEKIRALNVWIKGHAEEQGMIYLDFYFAMLDDKRMLRRNLTIDGLHPNEAGYAVMEALAEEAIAAALR
jgi:lysophospholipase L1-like esterase